MEDGNNQNQNTDKKIRQKTADPRRWDVSTKDSNPSAANSGYYSKFREKQQQNRITTVHGYQKPLDKKVRRSTMTSRPSITALNPYYKMPLMSEKQQHHYNLDEIKMEKVKRKFSKTNQ